MGWASIMFVKKVLCRLGKKTLAFRFFCVWILLIIGKVAVHLCEGGLTMVGMAEF